MHNRNRINVGYLPDRGQFGLWLYMVGGTASNNDDAYLLTEDGLDPHNPGEFRQATITLEREQLEVLMTRLWAEGIRPSDWGSEGETAALKNHLADMRKLALEGK